MYHTCALDILCMAFNGLHFISILSAQEKVESFLRSVCRVMDTSPSHYFFSRFTLRLVKPVLNGQPVLSGQLVLLQWRPLITGLTVIVVLK